MPRSSVYVSHEDEGHLMQQRAPSVNSPITPACASHSSSVSADGVVGVAHSTHVDEEGIPQSVKGAPEHLRPVIRKKQNSESARRSRQRRKVAAKAFYERFDDQCKRLQELETKVATLADLVRKKREREAEADADCEIDAEADESGSAMHDDNESAMQVDEDEVSLDNLTRRAPQAAAASPDASYAHARTHAPQLAAVHAHAVQAAQAHVAQVAQVAHAHAAQAHVAHAHVAQAHVAQAHAHVIAAPALERERFAREVGEQVVGNTSCGFASGSRLAGSESGATLTGMGCSVGSGLDGGVSSLGASSMRTGQSGATTNYVVGGVESVMGHLQVRKGGYGGLRKGHEKTEDASEPEGIRPARAAADVVRMHHSPQVVVQCVGVGDGRGDVHMGVENGGQNFGIVDNELDPYFADSVMPSQRLFSPC